MVIEKYSSDIFEATPMLRQVRDLWPEIQDIQINVLSRLSAKTLHRMKFVSKEWQKLISDRAFICCQLTSIESVSGFFFQERFRWSDDEMGFINYIPAEGKGEKVWRAVLNFLPEKVAIVSSVNGLMCCHGCFTSSHPNIYVCNPLNKQWITLQWPGISRSSSLALAVDPFMSPIDASTDFKVIAVSDTKTREGDCYLWFDIYSTETGLWKRSNELCQCTHKLIKSKGILVDGRLYWLTDGYQILMFDPQIELALLIEVPLPATHFSNTPEMCIGESQGRLCYVVISEDGLQLWVLEDYFLSQWGVTTFITLKELEEENPVVLSNISKKMANSITRTCGKLPAWIDPLAFKDGKLFVRVGTGIYLFEFETKKMKKLTEVSMLGLNPLDSPTVVPYSMSLVPLGEAHDTATPN